MNWLGLARGLLLFQGLKTWAVLAAMDTATPWKWLHLNAIFIVFIF